ncbi:hypothetical protein [Wolbachia endosymbiont (group B) of Melanostoma mellinum]|uniref:hypothetical protein n=1 Tax=Wolbachia endosymbiont (group B) of Melanostoma mellinum TaxID=2954030 RepID=UPI00223103D9|nr:hypothetical protein [Wolbachia endosymbiont (group B) of Melanostoma mellinum]
MWLILAYNEITILKSSYGTRGRPIDSKENSSHVSWFWLLKVVKLLVKYIARLIVISLRKVDVIYSKDKV